MGTLEETLRGDVCLLLLGIAQISQQVPLRCVENSFARDHDVSGWDAPAELVIAQVAAC